MNIARRDEFARFAKIVGMATTYIHEIKNRLTVIRSHAQIAHISDREASAHLDSIIHQVDYINELFNGIVSGFKPTEEDTIEYDYLNQIIEETIEFNSPRIEKKEIDIITAIQDDIKKSKHLAEYIRCVLFILIDNAVAATPHGGQITISCYCNQRQMVIRIIDTGPGIRSEEKKKIFEPFYSDKQTGFGLGLYLAQFLVHELLDGRMQVNSELGEGTEFIITTFPARSPACYSTI